MGQMGYWVLPPPTPCPQSSSENPCFLETNEHAASPESQLIMNSFVHCACRHILDTSTYYLFCSFLCLDDFHSCLSLSQTEQDRTPSALESLALEAEPSGHGRGPLCVDRRRKGLLWPNLMPDLILA